MAAQVIYPLIDILWWNLIGNWMFRVYTLGWDLWWIEKFLPRFDPGAPQWWLDTFHFSIWWDRNLDNRIPNTAFVLLYRRAARDRYRDWVEDSAGTIAGALVAVVSGLLGSLLHGYTTFSTWIEVIWDRVGTYIPWWTTSLAAGLVWLRLRLPEAIRDATATWDDIWAGIKNEVWSWVTAAYDAAKTWVANIGPWVTDQVNRFVTWYNAVGTWVTSFRNAPYATVAGILGYAWTVLEGMYFGLSHFYNTVWVPYKIDLHDFLDHPVMFLYDIFDDEVRDHLETFSRWLGKIAERVIIWGWERG